MRFRSPIRPQPLHVVDWTDKVNTSPLVFALLLLAAIAVMVGAS